MLAWIYNSLCSTSTQLQPHLSRGCCMLIPPRGRAFLTCRQMSSLRRATSRYACPLHASRCRLGSLWARLLLQNWTRGARLPPLTTKVLIVNSTSGFSWRRCKCICRVWWFNVSFQKVQKRWMWRRSPCKGLRNFLPFGYFLIGHKCTRVNYRFCWVKWGCVFSSGSLSWQKTTWRTCCSSWSVLLQLNPLRRRSSAKVIALQSIFIAFFDVMTCSLKLNTVCLFFPFRRGRGSCLYSHLLDQQMGGLLW